VIDSGGLSPVRARSTVNPTIFQLPLVIVLVVKILSFEHSSVVAKAKIRIAGERVRQTLKERQTQENQREVRGRWQTIRAALISAYRQSAARTQ
jgi:hypothetical protein